ncbi:MAG TPA: HAMP domain-containing sensor histidine kinase [Spirochaetia bacterium]|nr:HAMP domain-containing sensor histidine kinase [Spirochaetia bacterium]
MRRFAELVTALRTDPFRWARLKLTFSYLAIITIIVIILSSSVYSFHVLEVSRNVHHLTERLEIRTPSGSFEGALVPQITVVPELPRSFERSLTDYMEDLRRSIIIGDIITIIIAGALSFLLAGRTLRPIKEMLDRQSRFFANATHDLRTPLAVMTTEDEVALRRKLIDDRSARDLLNSNLEELRRMSVMVEQMRILSRSQGSGHGGKPAPKEDLPLDEITKGAVTKMTKRAQEFGVQISAEPLEAGAIRGNRESFERALFNVIENALAYTPAGGSVTLSVKKNGGHIELAVHDTGIGIAEKDLPHVTEPFYRADEARSTNTGGSGLGLTIVADIVSAHGGTLHFDSIPGKGTTVLMRFHIS